MCIYYFFPQLKVQTIQKMIAPRPISRGSAVHTENVIYVAPGDSYDIYCYQVKEDVWSGTQNKCSQRDFGLVFFGKELTAVGGRDASGRVTGKVFTLRQGKWIEQLPPLTQPCSNPAVVSTDCHLLAIGGHTGNSWCSSVQLLHRGDRTWTSLTSLPTTTVRPSATLIGEHVYIMADKKHSFFNSLANVLANRKPLPHLTWQHLPPFPPTVKYSAPSSCSLGGQLVIVADVGTIYQLLHGKWEECGHLSGELRSLCLLTSTDTNTMVAMGSCVGSSNNVDVCIVV